MGKGTKTVFSIFLNGRFIHFPLVSTKVIEMEPTNETNFYKRFRVLLRQQKFKEALADLNSALAIKPNYEQVLAQKGKLQTRMGRCQEAVADYTKLRRFL